MVAAMIALLTGLWAGLLRMGWGWPTLNPTMPMSHGPLMVCGFLGVLIGLERAVGLGRRWVFAAPALTALGTVGVLTQVAPWGGALAITLGSALLFIALTELVRIQPALFTSVIVLGAALWLAGNVVWLVGQPIPVATLWWIGFLVCTIAGERLELSRLLRLSTASQAIFVLCIILLLIGMTVGLVNFGAGVRILGVGLIGLAAWLLVYDIARRRVKAGGQTRFMALSLVSGYVWLAIAGLLMLWRGGFMAGPYYDAMLHALFLGFVFSMIFAHALIIFPAVLRVEMVYSPRLYSHLILLHVTLALRVASDLLLWQPGRLWNGLLNALALLIFLGNTLASIKRRR
jgi:hypothetical protein